LLTRHTSHLFPVYRCLSSAVRAHHTSPLLPYTTLFRSRYQNRARKILYLFSDFTASTVSPWSVDIEHCPEKIAPAVIERTLALRSEEHTSELQSREKLVCRLLLEKKTHVLYGAQRARAG